jgi:COP9 signalosome complex subunit 1
LQDVAIYGALCGMATLTRAELAQRIMHNPFFRELLELVPQVGVRLAGGVWAGLR